jgi:hypothetical protein
MSGAEDVVHFFSNPSIKTGAQAAFGILAGKATKPAGLVYRRIDSAIPSAKCYIGRCDSVQLFKRRMRDHARAKPTADYEYEVLDRADPGGTLRKAEQRQITAHGGPTNKSNPNGGTENKRNEIKQSKSSGCASGLSCKSGAGLEFWN